jgi:hypothetical protein
MRQRIGSSRTLCGAFLQERARSIVERMDDDAVGSTVPVNRSFADI